MLDKATTCGGHGATQGMEAALSQWERFESDFAKSDATCFLVLWPSSWMSSY